MRKSAVVIGFGAFFLTLALLLKFFAYDRLAIIPIDQNTSQTLSDPDASYFDVPSLTFKKGEVKTVLTVVADKAASEQQGDNTVVLNKWQYTNPADRMRAGNKDQTGKPTVMDGYEHHVAIDRNSGLPVHCCNESINGTPAPFDGNIIKLPFNTQKRSYPWWDSTLNRAIPLNYQGEEKIQGLSTYRFTSEIPEQVYKKEETPGFVFGMARDSAGQNADRSYQNTRTLWVEPETGIVIKASEHQRQFLAIPNHPKVPILDTTQVMEQATVDKVAGAIDGSVAPDSESFGADAGSPEASPAA